MMYAKNLGAGLLVVALVIAGCSPQGGTTRDAGKGTKGATADPGRKGEHAPHGKGPGGGLVFDLGAHHAEFTVDHDKKECTLLILDDDQKTPTPVAVKELTVTTKESRTKEGKVVAAMTIKMAPKDEVKGKATKFVGTDPGLGNVADFEGTVLGEIDGKPSQGTFNE